MMKKLLLTSCIALAGLTAGAQITITQTDIAGIGTVVRQANDTLPAPSIIPGPSGTNMTWNFTALDTSTIDTLTFTNPNWAPAAATFPSSNLAVYIQGGPSNTGYAYLENNSSGLWIHGNSDATGSQVFVNNPAQLITPFPATYGTNYTNTYSYTTEQPVAFPPYDSIRYKSTTATTAIFDAWGTVNTPLGSFPSIRAREIQVVTDSLWGHASGPFPPPGWYFLNVAKDTIYHYVWWANSVGFPLVEIDSSSTEGVQARWLMATPTITSTAQVEGNSGISIYPNPASNSININLTATDATLFIVYDASGRSVRSFDMTGTLTTISTEELAPGIYFYTASDKTGAVLHKGKFTINR
jgi:hypothetical protein